MFSEAHSCERFGYRNTFLIRNFYQIVSGFQIILQAITNAVIGNPAIDEGIRQTLAMRPGLVYPELSR